MARILYHYWRSSCSWRVRWALALKDLPFESRPVHLLHDEQVAAAYLALNPMGQVPALVTDGVALADSVAIIEYLEEVHPSPPLLPAEPLARAHVRRLANIVASGIQPLQNLGALRLHSPEKAEQRSWSRHWIDKGLRAYEVAAAPQAGAFSFGDTVTLADLCLIPQVYNALRFKLDMAPYPLVAAIYERALATPACDAAAPHNQDGAE